MNFSQRFLKPLSVLLLLTFLLSGCATVVHQPYVGLNRENPQFERGISFWPLDAFGDLISKIPQLLLWNRKYGNHQITAETEKYIADFLSDYQMTSVKIRINQWAPHKEIGRLVMNREIAWPYKLLYFPSTLLVSLIARPLSGLVVSDYYDPGSNTVNIFSDDPAIALHEAGHALDFRHQKYKGTYALARIVPGVNLIQEGLATDEAINYLEEKKLYNDLIRSYKILYPAYATYAFSYIAISPIGYVGGVIIGHWAGRFKAREKTWQLESEGKWQSAAGTLAGFPQSQNPN